MKIKYGEKVYLFVWVLFAIMFLSWGFGLYYFEISVTNKFYTFDESLLLNRPCIIFNYWGMFLFFINKYIYIYLYIFNIKLLIINYFY